MILSNMALNTNFNLLFALTVMNLSGIKGSHNFSLDIRNCRYREIIINLTCYTSNLNAFLIKN